MDKVDIIIFGCGKVSSREEALVESVAQSSIPIFWPMSHFEVPDCRKLFHRGAIDVGPRPELPAQIVELVTGAFRSARRHARQKEPRVTAVMA